MNWTEILRSAGVPDAPGYQELQALIREEREVALLTQPQGAPKKRKRGKKRG